MDYSGDYMSDLLDVVTIPLKKLAQMLFSLTIGETNIGSLIVIGFLFVVLISAIMHITGVPRGIGRIVSKIRDRKKD